MRAPTEDCAMVGHFMVEAMAQSSTPLLSRNAPLSKRVDHRQLIAAHRAVSGLEHALQFSPALAANAFRDVVWLLDGLAAIALDGEPVWMQMVVDEPSNVGVQRAFTDQSIASSLALSNRFIGLTQSMAMQIACKLSGDLSQKNVIRRDAYSNDVLQQGLSHWEHFVSDKAGDEDSLVMCAIADAKFRRLSPFNSSNSATAALLLNANLRNEQVLQQAPLCLSSYFNRHAQQFTQALADDDTVVRFYLTAITELSLELLKCLARLVDHLEYCQKTVVDTLSRAPVDLVMQAICRPVCTNNDLMEAGISRRQTSATYLKKLSDVGLLESSRQGKELRYSNPGVIKAFQPII